MELYLGGPKGEDADWRAAATIIREVVRTVPDDALAVKMLDVITGLSQPDGSAPADWPGFRRLEDK